MKPLHIPVLRLGGLQRLTDVDKRADSPILARFGYAFPAGGTLLFLAGHSITGRLGLHLAALLQRCLVFRVRRIRSIGIAGFEQRLTQCFRLCLLFKLRSLFFLLLLLVLRGVRGRRVQSLYRVQLVLQLIDISGHVTSLSINRVYRNLSIRAVYLVLLF